jgi:hypothetical protein
MNRSEQERRLNRLVEPKPKPIEISELAAFIVFVNLLLCAAILGAICGTPF